MGIKNTFFCLSINKWMRSNIANANDYDGFILAHYLHIISSLITFSRTIYICIMTLCRNHRGDMRYALKNYVSSCRLWNSSKLMKILHIVRTLAIYLSESFKSRNRATCLLYLELFVNLKI